MNVPDLAEDLLVAYAANDTLKFAEICARLEGANNDRRVVAERLMEVVCKSDVRRAERAVNILRVTGIALEHDWYQHLTEIGEKIFSSEVVLSLAVDQSSKPENTSQKIPYQMRLLRSIIQALARKWTPRAVTFVDQVEAQCAGTPLAARVAKWRQSS